MVMKNLKFKFIAVAIVVLCGCFAPLAQVGATEVPKPDDATWLVDEGENHVWYKLEGTTLTVGGSGEMPDWYETYNVDRPDSFIFAPWRDSETHLFKNIAKIVIEEGVTRVGNASFQLSTKSGSADTSSVTEVVLPESLKSIGSNAFRFNTALEKVNFPSKLTTMDYSAFQGCGLKEVVLPESLETLSMAAFYNNASLIKVTLPSKLSQIQQQAFYGCTGLKEIISYNNVAPTLGTNVFKNVNLDNATGLVKELRKNS